MEKKATEMMVDLEGGWLYFRTNAANAKKALKELRQELEYAGIDDSNVEYGNLELRDANGETIDSFKTSYDKNQNSDCNHDCEALYKAYQKGKSDERVRILKAIEGGE